MKIILKTDVDKLGAAGEVVDVKPGFARNYLIPRDLAVIATKANIKALEEQQRQAEVQEEKVRHDAQAIADKLSSVSVTAKVQVGEEEKVFGSVTSQDIAELLAEQGHKVDRRKIELDEPLKALGVYDVSIKIHSDIHATIKVWVVRE
jgi:large subunit ribosomal protein L9